MRIPDMPIRPELVKTAGIQKPFEIAMQTARGVN